MFLDINDLFKMKEQTELDVEGLKEADAELMASHKKQRDAIEEKVRALERERNALDRETSEKRGLTEYQIKELQRNLWTERDYFMRRIALASLKKMLPEKFSTKEFDTEYDFQKKPLHIEVLYETPMLALIASCFDITEQYGPSNRTNKVQLFVNVIAAEGFGSGRGDERGIYELVGLCYAGVNYNHPGGHHNISFDAPRLYDNRFKNLEDAKAFIGRNKGKWLKEAKEKMDAFAKEVNDAPAFEDIFDFRLLFGGDLDNYKIEGERRHQLSLSRQVNWATKERKEFLVRFDGLPGDVDFEVDFADPVERYEIMRGIAQAFKARHLNAEVSALYHLAEEWKENQKKQAQVAC